MYLIQCNIAIQQIVSFGECQRWIYKLDYNDVVTTALLAWNLLLICTFAVIDWTLFVHRCDFICALFQILRQCTNWRIRIRIEIHMWKLGIKNMKSPKIICHVDVEIGIILNWRLSCSYRLQSRLPTKNQHEKKMRLGFGGWDWKIL